MAMCLNEQGNHDDIEAVVNEYLYSPAQADNQNNHKTICIQSVYKTNYRIP